MGVVVLPVQEGVPDAEGPGPGVQGAGRGVREPLVRQSGASLAQRDGLHRSGGPPMVDSGQQRLYDGVRDLRHSPPHSDRPERPHCRPPPAHALRPAVPEDIGQGGGKGQGRRIVL